MLLILAKASMIKPNKSFKNNFYGTVDQWMRIVATIKM